jgi:hypothetical protein
VLVAEGIATIDSEFSGVKAGFVRVMLAFIWVDGVLVLEDSSDTNLVSVGVGKALPHPGIFLSNLSGQKSENINKDKIAIITTLYTLHIGSKPFFFRKETNFRKGRVIEFPESVERILSVLSNGFTGSLLISFSSSEHSA